MTLIITHLSGGYTGQRLVMTKPCITCGRAADNDVVVSPQDLRASSHHAVIFAEGSDYVIEDLDSTNGTYVGSVRIKRAKLKSGDVVELGRKGPRVLVEFSQVAEPTAAVRTVTPEDATLSSSTAGSSSLSEGAPSRRLGRATVQLMIDHALKTSSTRFSRLTIGLALLVAVAVVISVYFALVSKRVERSFSSVAEQNQAAVVLIRNRFRLLDTSSRPLSEGTSEGSGFAINREGLIVTNYHVVRPWEFDPQVQSGQSRGVSQSIKVIFADTTPGDAIEAQVLRSSRESDLAILKIPPQGRMPVIEGLEPDLATVRQGDEVALIGFPLGSALLQTTAQERATTTVTRSTVSKVSPSIIQLDAPVFQGYSGSPIFNREGKVVGVLTARLGELGEPIDPSARSIGLGTPIRFVIELLRQ